MKKNILYAITFFISQCMFGQSANTSLSNLAATKINHSLTPGTTNSLSLGSGNNGWRNLYLTNGLYLNNQKFISTSGTGNNFIGTFSGYSLHSGVYSGIYNTALGYYSLYSNTSGSYNTALGSFALYSNQITEHYYAGNYNTAVGDSALFSNQSGGENTAIGNNALHFNLNGDYNTASGSYALYQNLGAQNTAYGAKAMTYNTSGSQNTAIGGQALNLNTSGTNNTALGFNCLYENQGNFNTGVGVYALEYTGYSENNTAVGWGAGSSADNGFNNVFLGANTYLNEDGLYNSIVIGEAAIGTRSNQVIIGNSSTISYWAYANWTNISDGRVKKNIKENVPGLAFINKLHPVTYNLDLNAADNIIQSVKMDSAKKIFHNRFDDAAKIEKEKVVYSGFIAQDVEKAAKSLSYDFSGVDAAKNSKDLYGLRYAEFVVPLVKAVQELSKKNDEKDSAINNLQQQINEMKSIVNNISSVVSNQTGIISSATLTQYPNPFLNETTISYSIPHAYSSATINVTSENGVTIKQFNLSGSKGAVRVNGSTLSAGVYHYSLYVDGELIANKQMILIK